MRKPRRQTKLQKLILQYMPELEEAQKRVKELKGKESNALRRAQKSKSKSRGKYGKIFSFSDIKTQKQLNREIVRIRTFLSDERSEQSKRKTSRRKPFWEEYNPKTAGKAKKDETYSAYRRLQERFGGEERFKAIIDEWQSSHGKYDSENILEDIDYDFSIGMSEEDIMNKYEEIFEEMETAYKGLANNEE